MKNKKNFFFICLTFLLLILSGCQSNTKKSTSQGIRDNTPIVLEPQVSQNITFGNNKITFDLSHNEDGYIMVKYFGSNKKVKVKITNPNDSTPYTYDVLDGYNIYPLTGGNGDYTFQAFENVQEELYSTLYTKTYTIELKDEYSTYLYPNQYVHYNQDTQAVLKGKEIAEGSDTDLDVVERVYNYIVENIQYDDEKAQEVKDGNLKGYLPNVDEILESQKGICFDYAALTATMLRTQNIPTRMMIGYAKTNEGNIYHAWIGVYIKEIGWIDDFIQFDGKNWSMMDPTFASDSQDSQTVKDFITNKNNYTVKYMY